MGRKPKVEFKENTRMYGGGRKSLEIDDYGDHCSSGSENPLRVSRPGSPTVLQVVESLRKIKRTENVYENIGGLKLQKKNNGLKFFVKR